MIKLRSKRAIQLERRAQVRLMLGLEIRGRNRLLAEFQRLAGSVKHNVSQGYSATSHNVITDHRVHLRPILDSVYHSAAKVFLMRVFKAAPKGRIEAEATVNEWIKEWTATRIKDISKTTEDYIIAAVAAHEGEELTRDELADFIESRLGGVGAANRAAVIARTETHAAAQYGSLAGASELGIPGLQKVWVATGDDRTREDHADADGQKVNMDDPFSVGGADLDFPGDPSGPAEEVINCRCCMVYE